VKTTCKKCGKTYVGTGWGHACGPGIPVPADIEIALHRERAERAEEEMELLRDRAERAEAEVARLKDYANTQTVSALNAEAEVARLREKIAGWHTIMVAASMDVDDLRMDLIRARMGAELGNIFDPAPTDRNEQAEGMAEYFAGQAPAPQPCPTCARVREAAYTSISVSATRLFAILNGEGEE